MPPRSGLTKRSANVLALCLIATACSERPHFAPLDSDGSALRDALGRRVILRGVNARIAGIFDVTFTDGRAPLEALPVFADADAARMHQLGFTLLRLPLSWSALEPADGTFDDGYLDRVAAAVDLCRAHGILVLLDLHQDAYSKEVGEDGAPRWAIVPAPTTTIGGPLTDLDQRRLSPVVLQAFKSFFADAQQLEEKYAAMAQHLAARFAGDEAVLGYEVMNEPVATDDQAIALAIKVAQAIRAVDAKHLVAFEPSVVRNLTDAAPLSSTPFPVAGAIYAPHVYTAVFGPPTRLADGSYVGALAASWQAASDEAASWQAPLLVGEFGIGPNDPSALAWIGHAYDGADATLASTAFWLWKEESQASWGLFDHAADDTWTERPAMVAAVSRPYASAVGGDLLTMAWDGTKLALLLRGRADVDPAHVVYFGSPPRARCDGHDVDAAPLGDGFFGVRCPDGKGDGEHTLDLTAAP